jgi:D-aminoacyl-tRNA deacylase
LLAFPHFLRKIGEKTFGFFAEIVSRLILLHFTVFCNNLALVSQKKRAGVVLEKGIWWKGIFTPIQALLMVQLGALMGCVTDKIAFHLLLAAYYICAMRVVIQRVQQASVTIGDNLKSTIAQGLLVLIGIEDADGADDITWLSNKMVNLRIFDDAEKVPNLSVKDIGGDILLVSQFTLHAATKKGNRPSYIRAAKPETAIPLYEKMIAQLQTDLGKPIQTGTFGADMQVALVNDGPVTIWIDSKSKD